MKSRLLLSASCAGEVVTGLALMALGAACWPDDTRRGLRVMAAYNAVVAAYMGFVGVRGGQIGVLWWPACAAHVALGSALAWMLLRK